jgi:hypothetical protein
MSTIKGNLVVFVNETANEAQINAFVNYGAKLINDTVEDKKVAEGIIASAVVLPVGTYTEKAKNGNLYPTSPFELVIEHNARVPFSVKESGVGLRFTTNLTMLGLAKPIKVKLVEYDRKAYANKYLCQLATNDYKGLVRLSKLGYVATKLAEWKQQTRDLLIASGYDPKEVTKYELKDLLGEELPTHTPYCVTLPESDSAIITFIVEKEGKEGKYYVQDFAWPWNVGLTHTGGAGLSQNLAYTSVLAEELEKAK